VPFTPAHAAAAWPIARIAPRLPLAPLVIGTLSPDFEYLVRLAPRSDLSHSLLGVIFFCLPTSLVAWAMFAALIRPALVDVPAARIDARLVGLGAVAATIGAFTHLAWDGFTHEHGWAVARIPALLPWYKVLQHASTVAGCLVVAAWLARRFRAEQAARAWRMGACAAATAVVAGVLNGLRALTGDAAQVLGFASVGAMVGLVLGAATFGAVVRLRRRGAPTTACRP